MNKIFAILLLGVHSFNICGYQLFFSLAEDAADKQMIASLDDNAYNEKDLIQIRLPLNIPYTTDWKEYERCDGQIELNGIHYNYVKRIVYHDTMYLYCIPNRQKTELNDTKNEYAKIVTDIPSGKKTEQTSGKRNCFPCEYNTSSMLYNFFASLSCSGTSRLLNNNHTAPGHLRLPIQPPDITA